MKAFCAPFEGKKITVLGLGLLGRGVGDVEFLAKCGAEIIVTDKKSESELAESVAQLSHFPNITFHLGGHVREDFSDGDGCDMVLKSAGVRLDSPEIAVARSAGVPVVMSTALFAKYAAEVGAAIVGVTGTRGKSTVSHLINYVLIRANKHTVLGGNVRGVSTLAMLPEIRKGDIVVLELDSWQLQGFGEMQISPHIAVMTNLMPDHQNYYVNMDEYFADKANIFKYQKEGDTLLVGKQVRQRVEAARPKVAPQVPPAIPSGWTLKLIGEHNRDNAAYAATALKALGLSAWEIRAGLESFEGVEGRLQFVKEVNGVKIYNDNNATTPEATIAALKALEKNIILIVGGSDKGLNLNPLIAEIKERCKKVVLLAGTGTHQIKKEFPEASVYENLKDAYTAAMKAAEKGDTILFSPTFASFGMFNNEYDRNDQFLALAMRSFSEAGLVRPH